jgi:hypothetical protein
LQKVPIHLAKPSPSDQASLLSFSLSCFLCRHWGPQNDLFVLGQERKQDKETARFEPYFLLSRYYTQTRLFPRLTLRFAR